MPSAVACPRKPVWAGSVLLVWLLASISIFTYGQDYRTFRGQREDVINTAKYRFGYFFLLPTLGLRDIGMDGNVYYQREESNPVSDYTFTVYATVNLSYLFGRGVIFSITENPEYVYYFEQTRMRGWNNYFSPELRVLLLNRFVLSGSYSDSRARSRANPEFNAPVNLYRKGLKGSLFFETPRGTALGISGSAEEVRYGDVADVAFIVASDRKEQELKLETYYRIKGDSVLFLYGGHTDFRFINPLFRWRDAYSNQVYSGIKFPLLGRIRGTISLGYKRLTPRDVGRQKFSSLVGNTRFNLRVSRFDLRLSFLRDFFFSYWSRNIFYVGNQAGTGVSFYLTRFLRLDYDFNYGQYDYPEADIVLSPDGQPELIKRSDVVLTHRAAFVVRVVKSTGVGLAVDSWDRQSNVPFENRSRTFWGAYLTYEF